MLLKYILAAVLLSSSVAGYSLTVISEDSINPKNDIIILNEAIDQAVVDKTILRIHELESVDKDKPIYLLLDSPGGEVVEGARIIDAMLASKRPIYTVAIGEAASMAAIIHSYGVKRYMSPSAILMYHLISVNYSGDVVRIKSRLIMAQSLSDRFVKHICKNSSVKEKELNFKMMQEWWVNSEEAKERNLITDTIISTAFFMTKEEVKPPVTPLFPWLPLTPKKS